jgi:hypothetical protein
LTLWQSSARMIPVQRKYFASLSKAPKNVKGETSQQRPFFCIYKKKNSNDKITKKRSIC